MSLQTEVKNSVLMRNLNLSNIFQLIHDLGPIARKELAEQTDYSSATISNHVNTLLKQGFVIETEKGYSTGGRKPVYLTINPDKGYIFGVDIEVNEVRIVMFNLQLDVVQKSAIPIKEKNNPEQTIRRIFAEIDQIIQERELTTEKIIGIGVAVPGLIEKATGMLKFAPNLTWTDVELWDKFKNKYQVPVIIENEANAAAIGEKEFAHAEADNLVYVSVNEGIGCGVILGGELYRGASGNAGEFGHIIIDRTGPQCHCGNHGCWETLASETYIVKRTAEELAREEKLAIADIYSQAKQGDQNIISILKETGENLGVGVSNIINSLSPELVVVGGRITEIKEYLQEEMMQAVKEEALAVSYKEVTIQFSELEDSATAYGLANLVFTKKLVLSK